MSAPNILIFTTDHQRGDTVLPEHPARTPNVDRLAREGVTFTETFCTAPHSCPARASFMSGLYPSGHGVWNNVGNQQALSRGLKDGVRLWSEDLADAGYRLAYSGKWHVSAVESPRDRGWEELQLQAAPRSRAASPTAAADSYRRRPLEAPLVMETRLLADERHARRWDAFRKLAESPDPTERGEGEILRPGYGTYRLYGEGRKGGRDAKVTELAVQALPKLAAGEGPWCLYVGLTGPHDPYVVEQKYLDMYDLDDVPTPPGYNEDLEGKPRIVGRLREQIWGQLTEREVREGVRHFWAYCTYLDELFGKVLDALDETGQADDTLVLYSSDHGDYCGEHGLFAKGIPAYRGAYHVPAVIRWPKGVKHPGRRVDALTSLVDFAPTFLDLAGIETDRHLSGASLVPFLRGETPADWRDDMYHQCNGVELYYSQRTVFTRTHKYVFNGFDRDELYDLAKDPHETVNVADDPAYCEVKRDLVGRMWRHGEREDDGMTNADITVGLAPWGPAEAFRTSHHGGTEDTEHDD